MLYSRNGKKIGKERRRKAEMTKKSYDFANRSRQKNLFYCFEAQAVRHPGWRSFRSSFLFFWHRPFLFSCHSLFFSPALLLPSLPASFDGGCRVCGVLFRDGVARAFSGRCGWREWAAGGGAAPMSLCLLAVHVIFKAPCTKYFAHGALNIMHTVKMQGE